MSEQAQTEQKQNHALVKVLKSELVIKAAESYGIDPQTLYGTLFRTIFPRDREGKIKGTLEQFVAFLAVAKQYNLNPFTREIYAFPSKGGGVIPIVPIDGWVKLIQTRSDSAGHPLLDGIKYRDQVNDDGKLIAITCVLKRKDMSEPVEVCEYMEECFRSDSEAWKKWPRRMLRHKATIQCGRIAFGLAGIYDQDEAERIVQAEEAGTTLEGGTIMMPRRVEPAAAASAQAQEVDAEEMSTEEHHQEPTSEPPLTPKSYSEPESDSIQSEYEAICKEITALDSTWKMEPLSFHQKERESQLGLAKKLLEQVKAKQSKTRTEDSTVQGELLPADKKVDTPNPQVKTIPATVEPREKLPENYEKITDGQRKKLWAVIRSAKSEEKVRKFIWEEWGLQHTADIPKAKAQFDRVFKEAGSDTFKIH